MQQIFKDVVGYDGKYQVSNFGRVRLLNYNSERILNYYTSIKKHKNRNYISHSVTLYKNGKAKRFSISRLVYSTFNGKIPNGYQVDHINNNPEDNRLDNLQLLTASENSKKRFIDNPELSKSYKHNLQIINPRKKVICLNTGIIYDSTRQAERQLKISSANISGVCRGNWKHAKGYIFRFYEENNNEIEQLELNLVFIK